MNELNNVKEAPQAVNPATQTLEEMTKIFMSSSGDWSEKGLAMIKKYPLHTALVAGGIGFLIGTIVTRK